MQETTVVKLRHVDLNLLVALEALIKERNVTRAGAQLGIGQPAMSGALARLRNLLGDPLVERVGRELRLTPLAAELAGPLKTIMEDIECILERRSTFDPATSDRVFRIAGSDYVAISMLKQLVAYVSIVAPRVQLRFQRAVNTTRDALVACDIDLSVEPAGSHSGLASQHLFADRFVCAVWVGNSEVKDTLTEDQFCRLRHISYSYPPYGLGLIDHFAHPSAGGLQIQAVADSLSELPFLLRGTNLVALVQERLGVQLKAAADIRLLECPMKLSPLNVSMWWNELHETDLGHNWLRTTMLEVAGQRIAAGAGDCSSAYGY